MELPFSRAVEVDTPVMWNLRTMELLFTDMAKVDLVVAVVAAILEEAVAATLAEMST